MSRLSLFLDERVRRSAFITEPGSQLQLSPKSFREVSLKDMDMEMKQSSTGT